MVRPAVPDDVDGLIAAMGQAEFFRDRMRRQVSGRGVMLVALVGDRFVGDVFLSYETPAEPEIAARLDGTPALVHLEVAPAHQGRGIGTHIILEAEAEARRRGSTAIFLGVEPHNGRARRLYQRLGYVEWEHGTVPTGWPTECDGVRVMYRTTVHVLVKDLQEPPTAGGRGPGRPPTGSGGRR